MRAVFRCEAASCLTLGGAAVQLRVVVTRTQLTKLVIERNQGTNISMSAMKAGMSRNTARKYLRQNEIRAFVRWVVCVL